MISFFVRCCALVVLLLRVTAFAKSSLPPNVVMLFVDDLGYGDVGFNGHPTTKTPNIDKLAFNGKILSGRPLFTILVHVCLPSFSTPRLTIYY